MKITPRLRTGQHLVKRLAPLVVLMALPRPVLAQAPAGQPLVPPPTAPLLGGPASAKPAAPPATPAKGAPASALPAPSKEEAAEAKRHFDVGLKLFKEGVYDAALLEFQQSYRLGRRASALRNVAQSHRELKQFVDAYDAFERLLADHAAQLKDAEKKDIQRALNDLALVTGLLEIKANEPGADVLVDGKTVAQTPTAKKVRVAVGNRKVRLQKAGFEPVDKELLVVGQQEASIEFQLKPEVQQGHLMVRERTNQAVKILIDEKEVGNAPWEGDLPPGVHAVEAKGTNLAAPRQTIEIANKSKSEIVLDAVSTAAKVRIVALPASATISIDGKPVATGTYEGDVPEGEHKLEVTALGHLPFSRQMKAVGGQTLSQDVTLTVEPPKVGDKAEEGKPEYTGIYGSLFFNGQFELSGSTSAWPCGANQACERLPHMGGGLGLRLGYNIEWIGIEFVGMFQGSYSNQTLRTFGAAAQAGSTISPSSIARREETLNLIGYTPFLGLGVRGSTHGSVRLTGGFTPGVSIRNMAVLRRVTGGVEVPELPTSTAGNAGFGFLWDVGVMLGSTPGTKIYLAIMGFVDVVDPIATVPQGDRRGFVGTSEVQVSDGPFQLTSGANVYIGPSVGFHFGH